MEVSLLFNLVKKAVFSQVNSRKKTNIELLFGSEVKAHLIVGWNINTSVLGPTCLHTLYYGNLVYCFNNEVGSQNESSMKLAGFSR